MSPKGVVMHESGDGKCVREERVKARAETCTPETAMTSASETVVWMRRAMRAGVER